jgi:hypothetical protein
VEELSGFLKPHLRTRLLDGVSLQSPCRSGPGIARRAFLLYFLSYFIRWRLLSRLALSVRRLRDSGKEWYWIFTAFVRSLGWIWLIVLLCQPSVPT